MTTTMGKSRRAAGPALPRLAPVAAAVLVLAAGPASAVSGWDIIPSVSLKETYTDNVNLQSSELAEGQFVTELTPALSIGHTSRRLYLRSTFRVRAFAFTDHSVSGENRSANEFSLNSKATLIDDLLFLNLSGSRAQQTISAFGQQYAGNDYANANRAPVTTYSFSPYAVHSFGSTANLLLRFSRDSVQSSKTAQGAVTGLGNTTGTTVSANLSSGRAFRSVSWNVGYSDQTQESSITDDTKSQVLNTQLRYRVQPTVSLLVNAGYDKYDYSALGGVTKGASYSAGFDWNPSTRTRVEATVGHRFVGSTKSLLVTHRSRRTVWNISYNDTITTSRANFLLPATVDTASMLDQLFIANFPDPVERQRAVAQYIATTGLPAQLLDSINYFSNRFMLQKELRGSVAFKLARTVIVGSLYSTRRNALSTQQSDSQLLGSSVGTLNDNTEQLGASISMDYRLSPRSTLKLTQTNSRSESTVASFTSSSNATRLQFTRRLSKALNGSVEVRSVSGNTGLFAGPGGARNYRENAIAASLSLTL